MKKFLIIILVLVAVIGLYGASTAVTSENEYYVKINYELDNLKLYMEKGNELNAKNTVDRIREYVYGYAKYLIQYDIYNEEVMEIACFAAKAENENNLEYIMLARTALINVYKKNFKTEESNHS